MNDPRPENCRFRLQANGKTYPRSSCTACGKTITTGLGRECHLNTYDAGLAAGIEAAKKAIADLPWGRTEAVDEGHEQAFRAVEALTLLQIDMAQVTLQEVSGFDALIHDAKEEAKRAMVKFPQPNYVISKVAEEAGEVVKAAIHCAEGRESPSEVRGERKQLIAMLYRLWVEGDQIHGLRALSELSQQGNKHD
jgi:phosphoribosyl-ATP pyrophosphohydrolase